VGSFWAGKNVSDVETIAKNAESAANDLAAAAKAGDEAKMQSSLQAVNGSCGACHGAHREGSPGNYQIK
jgi:cytochrome c553